MLLKVASLVYLYQVCAVHGAIASVSNPQFISPSQTIRVEVGQTIRLPCDIKNLGNYIVLWKRNSSVLSASSLKIVRDERIRVVDTSIEISQAAPKDSGVYLCEINTDPAINLSVKLDVLEPARIRRLPEDGKVFAKKADSVTLQCNGEGNPMPIITWTRPGRLLPNGADVVHGPSLSFNSVGRQESGRYMCTADNGVGEPATATLEIHVLYPPEIETDRNWVHSGVGQETYLTCHVHAEPIATILWYRQDRVIVPSDNRILESSGTKNKLILRNVEEADFGHYSCVADNSLGRSSQSIELSARPSRAIFDSEPMGVSTDSYNLTWRLESFAPVEEYRLMFRKLQFNESDDLNRSWSSIIIPVNNVPTQNQYHKQSYLLEELDTGSVYEATVTARNRYGTSELSEAFQFYTLGSEHVPNAKNLEAKNLSPKGFENMSSAAVNNAVTYSFLLVVMATQL